MKFAVFEQIKKQVKEFADLEFVRKTALRAVKEKQTGLVRDMEIVEQEIQELIEKKGLLLEGYHIGDYTREGYLEGRRQLEQRISVLEQRRAGIRDEMAECEKLPESERKGQEFLQLSEPDLGGECYYSVKLEEIPKNQGVPLISSKRKTAVKNGGRDGNKLF